MILMDILGGIFAIGLMFIIGIILFYTVLAVGFLILFGVLICTFIACAIGPIFLVFGTGNIFCLGYYLITIPILFYVTEAIFP